MVKFNSRRDAALFYNAVQKQLRKEHSINGFTEYESVSYWKGKSVLIVAICFKDPVTMEEAKGLLYIWTNSFESSRLLFPSLFYDSWQFSGR